MDFNEQMKEILEQHDRDVRSKVINEFYTAISNYYKIYKCVPGINFIGEIAENLKGELE